MRSYDSTRARWAACALLLVAVTLSLVAGCKEPSLSAKTTKSNQRKTATVAAGTTMIATLQTALATNTSSVGNRVSLLVTDPVSVPDGIVVPAGSKVLGEVTHVLAAGRVKGAAELTLRFHELVLPDGKQYTINCEPFRVRSAGDGRESAATIGGGAAAGGIIGGILGDRHDVLPGAAIGAILGTGVAVATKGDVIELPVGQKLKVTLTAPVTVLMPPHA